MGARAGGEVSSYHPSGRKGEEQEILLQTSIPLCGTAPSEGKALNLESRK